MYAVWDKPGSQGICRDDLMFVQTSRFDIWHNSGKVVSILIEFYIIEHHDSWQSWLLNIQYLQPVNSASEDPLASDFAQAAAALKERLEEQNMPIDDKVAK